MASSTKRELVMTPIEPVTGKPGTVYVDWALFEDAVYNDPMDTDFSYHNIKVSDIVNMEKSKQLIAGGHGSSFDKIQYWWYYLNADGLWITGDSGDSQDSPITFEYPEDATKLKVKIEPIAKHHWAENRLQWTMDAVTSPEVKISDIKRQETLVKPVPPSLSDFSIAESIASTKLTTVAFAVSSEIVDFYDLDFQYKNESTGKIKTVHFNEDYGSKVHRVSFDASRDQEFRVRARIYNHEGVHSEYCEWSALIYTLPSVVTSWWVSPYEVKNVSADVDGIMFYWMLNRNPVERSDLYTGMIIEYRDITAGETEFEYQSTEIEFRDCVYNTDDGTWRYLLTGLTDGHSYGVRIAINNQNGAGRFTSEKKIRVGGAPDPEIPSAPNVERFSSYNQGKPDRLRVTLQTTDVNTSYITYDVWRKPITDSGNKGWTYYTTGTDNLSTGESVWLCEIDDNTYSYKVRAKGCKSYNAAYVLNHGITETVIKSKSGSIVGSYFDSVVGDTTLVEESDWSEWSNEIFPRPDAPTNLTVRMTSQYYRMSASWTKPKGKYKGYTIEYAEHIEDFDRTGFTKTIQVSDPYQRITSTEWDIENKGATYYFRIAAVGEDDVLSRWSDFVSITVGKKPAIPSIWTYSNVVPADTIPTFCIVHNTEDNSIMKKCRVTVLFCDITTKEIIETKMFEFDGTGDPNEAPDTVHYFTPSAEEWSNYLNKDYYIEWYANTLGAYNETDPWSNDSAHKIFTICIPPSLSVTVAGSGKNYGVTNVEIESYPLYIHVDTLPTSQKPTNYYISIVALEDYEYTNNVGVPTLVLAGDQLYSAVYSPMYDYDLAPYEETVRYPEERTIIKYRRVQTPAKSENAIDIAILPTDVLLKSHVRYAIVTSVSMNSGLNADGTATFSIEESTDMPAPQGTIIYDSNTYTANIICSCTDPDTLDFDPDITISIYRRDFDGQFVLIAEDLPNGIFNKATDPHPAMDYARYRLVAINNRTGAITYSDIDDLYIGEAGIILQWDETWVDYSSSSLQVPEQQGWKGTLIHLLGNATIGDNFDPDVNLVKYIGRDNPVSYYGTQIGQTSSWSCEVPREDKDVIFALRRLSRYMGNVYVRESSGTGYMATVKVSLSMEYNKPSVPVSLDVTRVDASYSNLGAIGYTNGG